MHHVLLFILEMEKLVEKSNLEQKTKAQGHEGISSRAYM